MSIIDASPLRGQAYFVYAKDGLIFRSRLFKLSKNENTKNDITEAFSNLLDEIKGVRKVNLHRLDKHVDLATKIDIYNSISRLDQKMNDIKLVDYLVNRFFGKFLDDDSNVGSRLTKLELQIQKLQKKNI